MVLFNRVNTVALAASMFLFGSLSVSGCTVKPQVIQAQGSSERLQEDLVVVGYSQVEVVPDKAELFVGVKERNDDAALAIQAAQVKAQGLLATLDAMGIPKEDVTTDSVNLHEEYEGGHPRYRFRGMVEEAGSARSSKKPSKRYFEAIYIVRVTLTDISKVGAVLAQARKNGANEVSQLNFDVKEPEVYLNEARGKAVQNAIAQANVLAQSSGHTLGEIQSVSTNWRGGGEDYYGIPRGVVAGLMGEAMNGREFPIRPGKMTFERKVRVSFSLKKP